MYRTASLCACCAISLRSRRPFSLALYYVCVFIAHALLILYIIFKAHASVVPVMPEAADVDDHSSVHLIGVQHAESPQESDELDIPRDIDNQISIQNVKLSLSSHHAEDTRRVEPSCHTAIHPEHPTDNASVQSLPVAHVTDPEPTRQQRPSTARGEISPRSPSSFSYDQSTQDDMSSTSQPHHRLRHRSGAEVSAAAY